jgi:hypothetical protein
MNTSTSKSKSKASEQPDETYLARIDTGELCRYEIVDGELVELPVQPESVDVETR